MKTYLKDILDPFTLNEVVSKGYVRAQYHPTETLVIYNYTEKTVYERMWDDITRTCRGLIVDTISGEVVARPFPKFFNYGEPGAADIGLDETVIVTDKMDGSLGILYWQPEAHDWAIATRGSFTSDQAKYATGMLSRYDWDYNSVAQGVTLLFEIVYPENRIVLDYGDTEGLFLLAGVDIKTGRVSRVPVRSFPHTQSFGAMTLGEALARRPRQNAEGIVVRTADSRMLKVKQEDYVRLHRVISGLSERTVWEYMTEGKSLEDLKQGLPEEFWPFIDKTHHSLLQDQYEILSKVDAEASTITSCLDKAFGRNQWSRAHFAAYAKERQYGPLLFMLLDKKDIGPVVLRQLKPRGDSKPFNRGEDVS